MVTLAPVAFTSAAVSVTGPVRVLKEATPAEDTVQVDPSVQVCPFTVVDACARAALLIEALGKVSVPNAVKLVTLILGLPLNPAALVAVSALPFSAALIMFAAKFPLASRATMVDAVFALVASLVMVTLAEPL
jgi:hypothetical protein